MRIASLLDAGFVLPIGHFTPREEQALLIVRGARLEYVKRRDKRT